MISDGDCEHNRDDDVNNCNGNDDKSKGSVYDDDGAQYYYRDMYSGNHDSNDERMRTEPL